MKIFLAAVIILCSADSFSQEKNTIRFPLLSVKDYQHDLQVFRQIYTKANAGLYKYRTRARIDSIFAAAAKAITPSTSFLDFYKQLCTIVDFTGSCHNDVQLPHEVDSMLTKETAFFPLPVKIISGKALVNIDSSAIPAGAAIISINQVAITDIMKSLYKYVTTDGYNVTGKLLYMGDDFPFYYRLEYGPFAQFHVQYMPANSHEICTTTLTAINYAAYKKNYARRHSLPTDTTLYRKYAFRTIDPLHTAVLTVNTFAWGGIKRERHKKYAAFLDSVFKVLKETPSINNLVIDIRKNTGGDDPNDLLLFSYLATQKYKENKTAFTLFQQVPLKQYYVAEDSTDISELEKDLKEEHNIFKNGRYYQSPRFNPFWSPKPNAFRGNLYMLTGPAVASAGSLFAALVRSEQRAVVIGEETLGGYYGHTGHIPVEYKLPHSGIITGFSIVDLEQWVKQDPRFPAGRGIMPDHLVPQTTAGFLNNTDIALNFVLALIRTRATPTR